MTHKKGAQKKSMIIKGCEDLESNTVNVSLQLNSWREYIKHLRVNDKRQYNHIIILPHELAMI